MSNILRTIAEDALRLKVMINGARVSGALKDIDAQHAMSGCARILQAIGDVPGAPEVADDDRPPLSEYFRFPNDRVPCPKCGSAKRRYLDYEPATRLTDERMKHTCYCGYFIYTKPLDASDDGVAVDGDGAR